MTTSTRPVIRVAMGSRGRWAVVAGEAEPPARCETLQDACQMAHRRAERDAPCELVIRDAYHHVVSHEFVAARKPESPQTTE